MAAGEFLLYQTDDGRTRVGCRCAHETLWLSQAGIAEDSVVNRWLTTAADGKSYSVVNKAGRKKST